MTRDNRSPEDKQKTIGFWIARVGSKTSVNFFSFPILSAEESDEVEERIKRFYPEDSIYFSNILPELGELDNMYIFSKGKHEN